VIKFNYRLTMNGILKGEYETLDDAYERATTLEGRELEWKQLDADFAYYALGKVINGLRTDWEIQLVRKRV
jgi:hypothetical protein